MKAFITFVQDYHDFAILQRSFNHAQLNLNYEEVGCGRSELSRIYPYGCYHAIFYEVDKKDNTETTELIKKWKDYFGN